MKEEERNRICAKIFTRKAFEVKIWWINKEKKEVLNSTTKRIELCSAKSLVESSEKWDSSPNDEFGSHWIVHLIEVWNFILFLSFCLWSNSFNYLLIFKSIKFSYSFNFFMFSFHWNESLKVSNNKWMLSTKLRWLMTSIYFQPFVRSFLTSTLKSSRKCKSNFVATQDCTARLCEKLLSFFFSSFSICVDTAECYFITIIIIVIFVDTSNAQHSVLLRLSYDKAAGNLTHVQLASVKFEDRHTDYVTKDAVANFSPIVCQVFYFLHKLQKYSNGIFIIVDLFRRCITPGALHSPEHMSSLIKNHKPPLPN